MTGPAFPIKCRIRAEADGITRVDVFEDIGPGGWFSDGLTAKDFSAQLAKVTGPLQVNISSGGGDVFDGIAIANTIRNYKGPKTTVNDGIAASIASVIFQAGDERIIQNGAMVMIHDAFGMVLGNAEEARKFADTLDQVSDNIAGIYASRAGGTAEQWRDAMKAETWYTAEQAVAEGLADRIGDGTAQLPAGLDVAAFTAVPGRIAAALRAMPKAKAPVIVDADGNHGPMTGSHGHSHPAYGSQGGDSSHAHDHSHAGNASHDHSHDGDGDGAQDRASRPQDGPGKPYKPAPYSRDADETVQCPSCKKFNDIDAAWCDQCGTKLTGRTDVEETAGPGQSAPDTGDGTDGADKGNGGKKGKKAARKARLRVAAAGACCSACGPDCACGGQPAARGPVTLDAQFVTWLRNAVRAEIRAAAVDESDWDASKAWSAGAASDDPAGFYAAICAGEKTGGDKDTQGHWALPHHYAPGKPPNRNGVNAAKGRIGQAQDLKDKAAAQAHLDAHSDAMGSAGDDDAGNHSHADLTGIDLAEIRAALKGATE